MTTTSTGTAERVWSAAEIARGLDLIEAGASVRKLAAELGVSRHQAERFAKLARPEAPKPNPHPPGTFTGGVTLEDGARRPTSARAYEPPPPPGALENLQLTRAELKSKLDYAAQVGDRAGVSTYSLALARLNKTDDPGVNPQGDTGSLDLSHLPTWALEMLELILRSSAVNERGERIGELTPAQGARWARYESALAKVT